MSIVQEIMIRSADNLRRTTAPVGGQGGVTMSCLCPHCNRFPLEDYVWWVSGRNHKVVVRKLWKKYDWRQPNRLLVVQTGESFQQAKVFKTHAVPQDLCANLINALRLLANQQEDGDGLLQNIVLDLCQESRKGLTDSLREFIKVDNERALDVGYLSRDTGTFQVRKPKVPEGCQEVIVRESLDELTLRAEELGTSKALINVDHIEQERWVLPWLMLTGMLSARRCTRASKEKTEKTCTFRTKMSRAVVVKKPQEAQKAKALWKMKAAKDAGEEYHDLMRKDSIKGRNKTRLALWEEHLKDPIAALDKALKCVEDQY